MEFTDKTFVTKQVNYLELCKTQKTMMLSMPFECYITVLFLHTTKLRLVSIESTWK